MNRMFGLPFGMSAATVDGDPNATTAAKSTAAPFDHLSGMFVAPSFAASVQVSRAYARGIVEADGGRRLSDFRKL